VRSYGNRSTDSTESSRVVSYEGNKQQKLVWVDIQAHQSTILFPQLEASRNNIPSEATLHLLKFENP
jgi:hypothetical protein